MPIHLECGERNAIAFVLSCPGQQEQQECRPAAGPTGNNLKKVLRVMRGYSYDDIENLECDDWTRGNIWITNAWPCVEYKKCTKRSEPTNSEILTTENISRLANELDQIENVIVCCGQKAQRSVNCLRKEEKLHHAVIVVSLRHLSNQALNTWIPICKLSETKPEKRRQQRLERWACCLYNRIVAKQNKRSK